MASIIFDIGQPNTTKAARQFVYKDISVPFTVNKNNYDFKQLQDEEAIMMSFESIFSWRKGERILNPEFGNPAYEFLGEIISPDSAAAMPSAFRTAIQRWEPRVIITNLTIEPNPEMYEFLINITYEIPRVNSSSRTYSFIAQRG